MKNKIYEFVNLHQGEENKEKVIENIRSNVSFRGSNLWILVCAIVIASIGLNLNSTAVIIGAMLISPLMWPIVWTWLALAILDFWLLKKSWKNLFIATIVSLFVATIYFYISPFKDIQSELLSRTSPNIYDVLIAFFGGLVWAIALTRVEKGNPIPWVAIATALMPPLCTAGYGLATANYTYFFGAFYLYTINCVFIFISTFIIIKFLKYQPLKVLNLKFEKQIRYSISILVMVMIIPSFYLAYDLFQEKKYISSVESFIKNEFTNNEYTLIYKQTKFNTNPKIIELAFLTKKFSLEEIKLLNQKLLLYGITNTELDIKQDTKDLKLEILNELGNQDKILSEKDIAINSLRLELSKYQINNTEIMNEISILFPELKDVSIAKHLVSQDVDTSESIWLLLYKTDSEDIDIDSEKITNWLQQKLQASQIKLVKLN